mmetsp:Transcript_60461/g.179131  ORF Transcript_60461/g.179131 Transcript_60461/m.179131 type:complete len:80 (+) Transcript_60461:187-426(+)
MLTIAAHNNLNKIGFRREGSPLAANPCATDSTPGRVITGIICSSFKLFRSHGTYQIALRTFGIFFVYSRFLFVGASNSR